MLKGRGYRLKVGNNWRFALLVPICRWSGDRCPFADRSWFPLAGIMMAFGFLAGLVNADEDSWSGLSVGGRRGIRSTSSCKRSATSFEPVRLYLHITTTATLLSARQRATGSAHSWKSTSAEGGCAWPFVEQPQVEAAPHRRGPSEWSDVAKVIAAGPGGAARRIARLCATRGGRTDPGNTAVGAVRETTHDGRAVREAPRKCG